jgi:hypothetical protein
MFINTSNISKLSNKKISNNENDSSYTIGLSGNVYQGKPEIFYTDIIYIQDSQQIWTHGVLYNCMSNTKSTDADLTDNNIDDREIKDLLDISTNKRIYIKGHTDAIYTNDGDTVSSVLDELYDLVGSQESIIASIEQQIAGKQDSLVSGTNIKTINGQSILGDGDISNLAEKTYVDEVIQSKVFVGTRNEYDTAYAEGKIAMGALVIILDGSEIEGGSTISALLGTAILGQMLLGQK